MGVTSPKQQEIGSREELGKGRTGQLRAQSSLSEGPA